jgi:hypothetical protein
MRVGVVAIALGCLAGPGAAADDDLATATRRARVGDFDAVAEVRCAQDIGRSLVACRGGVARSGPASVVVVTFPNGFVRRLSFSDGDFLRGDATMSGVGTDTDWQLAQGLYRLRVDDQRFEVPEALVVGP